MALDDRSLIRSLTSQTGPLELRPILTGPWKRSWLYPKGALVTHEGRLWRSKYITPERPGASPDWLPIDGDANT